MTTVELLDRLVSFDTTSRNSNLPLIGFVREYLDAHGVPYRVSLDETGQKANIHAIIGPQAAGGVALSGHVDTVPVDGQAWSTDPFSLRQKDGLLYARGACDMKGFPCLSPFRLSSQHMLPFFIHKTASTSSSPPHTPDRTPPPSPPASA